MVEQPRPEWEIPFERVNDAVISVMPGESDKTFFDPLIGCRVRWEQDAYCPACSVYDGRIVAVYRAYGEDDQWRMGLAWSSDGIRFERSDQPVFHARLDDPWLDLIRHDPSLSVSYGDSRLVASEDGTYYLYFSMFQHVTAQPQELAVASTRDFAGWSVHGRAFARAAKRDMDVIPEHAPWRFPHPAVVTRLEGDRLVATKIGGRYWMYLNCLSTIGRECLCAATSENLVDWQIVRDRSGGLVHPMPLRPGWFDSYYIDTVAAVVRDDGILLIYNGINDDPRRDGRSDLKQYAHYPAQALFDREDPTRLLKRSSSPFMGNVPELERIPIVFWHAPLYEAWSLVPWHGAWNLYWNHGFGRRAVGLCRSTDSPHRPLVNNDSRHAAGTTPKGDTS